MSLSSLSISQLKQLVLLLKYKEVLEKKLAGVTTQIDELGSGYSPTKGPASKRGPRQGRRRTKLKDLILKALMEAGKNGSSIKEVVTNTNLNPDSVSVWFYTTGKKIKGLQKLGPGRYSYLG